MAVIVDIPGVGPVEAKNAATEATLRELVNAMKGMGGRGGGAGGGAGGSAGGGPMAGAAAGAKGFSNAAGNAGKLLTKGFAGPALLAGKGLGLLVTSAPAAAGKLVDVAEAATEMISQLANVGSSLTQAAGVFRSIPVVGPLFSAAAGAAEGVADAFTNVASSGATFGGSIAAMARSAGEAGMTLKEFGDLIKSNGSGLLAFGTTTEGGAKQFARLSRDLRTTGSDLYALGFSTQEINDGLAKYGQLLRSQGLQGRQSNQQLVQGAKSYLKELDALAKITGEERSAKEKQMQELATDAQFAAAMAGKDEKVRASFQKTVLGLPGPLQGFVKDFLATGTLTTEETQRIGAMMGGEVMQELNNMRNKMNSGVALTAAEQDRLAMIMKKSAEQNLKNSGTALAASREMDSATNAMTSALQLNVGAHKQTAEEQANAAKNTDGMNEQVRKSQEALAQFSNSFMMTLAGSGILPVMMEAFGLLANIIQTFVVPAFNILTPIISKVFYGIQSLLMPVINSLSGSMGSLEGVVNFIDGVLNVAFALADANVRALSLAFSGLWNGTMRVLQPFQDLYTKLQDVIPGVGDFTDIIIQAGSLVGGAFEFLGEILGTIVEGYIEMYTAIFEWLSSFDFVKNALDVGGDMLKSAFETLKLYLSADGAKLLIAQMKDLLANTIVGFFQDMQDYFEDFFITLQNALPNMLGGISDEEAEERRKAIAERKEDRAKEAALDKKHIDNLKGAAMVTAGIKQGEVEAAKDANKAAAKEFSQRELNIKKMGGINDKEAGVRNEALKGKEEATKNLEDPIQLLLGEAKQQGKADAFQKQATAEAQAQLKAKQMATAANADLSKATEALGQIKTPESKAAAAAQGAKAGIEAKAEEKAAEVKKAEEAAKEAAKPTPTETPKPESAPGQTSGQTAIAQLNSNIEELVRLMRINNSLTSEQSSGLSRLAGSVTGDLFQV